MFEMGFHRAVCDAHGFGDLVIPLAETYQGGHFTFALAERSPQEQVFFLPLQLMLLCFGQLQIAVQNNILCEDPRWGRIV
jgi:hypothetical protein